MDVLAAIDAIDDLVHEARGVPLTDQVRVDGEAAARLVGRLRDEVDALADEAPRLSVNAVEEAGARAIYAQGEDACVARLLRLTEAARAAPGADVRLGDVVELVDRLEAAFREARGVPLSGDVRVEREAVYEILDRLRASVPALVRARANGGPEPLDEAGARALYRQGEAAVVERLVRVARAAAGYPPPGSPA